MAGSTRRHSGGSVRRLPSGRWQVRVFDPAAGRHVAVGTYPTKADANVALASAVADQTRGAWVPPERGRVTVEVYVRGWIDQHTSLTPRTRERYESVLRHHIAPHVGEARIGDLTVAAVRRWHASVHADKSAATAAKAYRLLRAALATAVADGLLAVNPCQVKGAGVERPAERPTATVAEVDALADAVPERFRLLVLLGAWCSLRLGELAALTRADFDLLHGTVKVSRARHVLDDGTSYVGPPKSEAGYRTVAIPPPLLADVRDHLARYVDPGSDALVFTGEQRAPVDRKRWGRTWRKARLEVGRPDLRFHDLRHTGNTLAAATGASLKELMARMGHSTTAAALIYQHASSDRDAAIARALGEVIRPADVTSLDERQPLDGA